VTVAHQDEPALDSGGADTSRCPPGPGAILRGLLGGVPITVLACLGALWIDRPSSPALLNRLAYPVALALGALGAAGWTRLATGRRAPELELTVVVVAVAAAVTMLSVLAVSLQ
jgi:hypothetical protein